MRSESELNLFDLGAGETTVTSASDFLKFQKPRNRLYFRESGDIIHLFDRSFLEGSIGPSFWGLLVIILKRAGALDFC
jgi:hypothetical protein